MTFRKMPQDVFERVEQLDHAAKNAIDEGRYDIAQRVIEDIRALISTAISKEVSPGRKQRLQALSDEYRDRFTKIRRLMKEGKAIAPRRQAPEPREPAAPPPPRAWNEPARGSPSDVPPDARPSAPRPTFASVASSASAATPPPPSPSPSPIYERHTMAPSGEAKSQPPYHAAAPRSLSPRSPGRRPRTPDRPFGYAPSAAPVTESPVTKASGGAASHPSAPQPAAPALASPRPTFSAVVQSGGRGAVDSLPPPAAIPSTQLPPSAPPSPLRAVNSAPARRPYGTPPSQPVEQPAWHQPLTTFRPKIMIPIGDYELDEDEDAGAGAAEPKEAPKTKYEPTPVVGQAVVPEPTFEPVQWRPPLQSASVETEAIVPPPPPSPPPPPQPPQPEYDPFADDPEAMAIINRDITDIVARMDVVKHTTHVAAMAQSALKRGLLLKAYRLLDHCHKVLGAATRKERDEARLNKLDDLDSHYRMQMLDLDRSIKQFGAVSAQTAGDGAGHAAAEDVQAGQEAATDPGRVVCFKCAKVVAPIKSHSMPDWLSCCCPAVWVCPECREPIEADASNEDIKQMIKRGSAANEGDEGGVVGEGGDHGDNHNNHDNHDNSENNAQSDEPEVRLKKPLCPQCNELVIPETVNSAPEFVALLCPCFNTVSYCCPQCKGPLPVPEEA